MGLTATAVLREAEITSPRATERGGRELREGERHRQSEKETRQEREDTQIVLNVSDLGLVIEDNGLLPC